MPFVARFLQSFQSQNFSQASSQHVQKPRGSGSVTSPGEGLTDTPAHEGPRAPGALVRRAEVGQPLMASPASRIRVSEVSERLSALSIEFPQRPMRPRVVDPQIVTVMPDGLPIRSGTAEGLGAPRAIQVCGHDNPEGLLHEEEAKRPSTLKPAKSGFKKVQLTLAEAKEDASLSIIAQKLRMGLSRMQKTGEANALSSAIAHAQIMVRADATLSAVRYDQTMALLAYLAQMASDATPRNFSEALKNIERLSAPRA